ncbi:unnamed protein product [Cochlearia groenlandica]
MPISINTSYVNNKGGGHGDMIHHLHHHTNATSSTSLSLNITTLNPLKVSSSNGNGIISKTHDHKGYNIMINNNNKEIKHVVIKYKECLKNHAASIGGNAIDGCGEFMPSGEEGSIEALTCLACNCHRNFHRKETEGGENIFFPPYHHNQLHQPQRKLMFHNHHKIMVKSPLPKQMIMPINGVATNGSNSESEDHTGVHGGGRFREPPPPCSYGGRSQKKRFRTKFTQEQKEKMLSFADRVGWKMQRQEESNVQELCQEIGVRRRVLKVWMHNNKHNLAKKSNNVNNNVEISVVNNEINKVTNDNLASSLVLSKIKNNLL